MSTLYNGIKVYDRDNLLTIVSYLWLHNPHTSIRTRLIANRLEPMNKCTGVYNVIVREFEEEKNLSHEKTSHS